VEHEARPKRTVPLWQRTQVQALPSRAYLSDGEDAKLVSFVASEPHAFVPESNAEASIVRFSLSACKVEPMLLLSAEPGALTRVSQPV
jgi:hypothetical protein